jgi:voltage-dependent potassium channel beta subunit
MEYRRLGRTGLKVSALSFGSWVTFGHQMKVEQAQACMKLAYDAGVNFFDNAEAYANGVAETIMGEVLRAAGWPRDSYCVSSKVMFGSVAHPLPTQKGLSHKHVVEACHQALRRLQVDYLDLYFCHRPDPETPIEETVRAMDTLVRQGKVFYWGTSEWPAAQIEEAHRVAREHHLTPPAMEQPEYSLFHRARVEREYLPLYHKHGMGTTIWSPLASGLLTGKYTGGIPSGSRAALPGFEWLKERFQSEEGREKIRRAAKLQAVADRLQVPLPRLAIAWCLRNPQVSTVILGASSLDQLRENLKAWNDTALLTPEILAELDLLCPA